MIALKIWRKVLLASIVAQATIWLLILFGDKVPVHPWLRQFSPWLLFVFPIFFASFFGMVVSSAACVILQIAALWAASRRR